MYEEGVEKHWFLMSPEQDPDEMHMILTRYINSEQYDIMYYC